MPTYQYVCTACEQPLEVVQSFSDAALTECPACGGTLRKVYGAVGVVFKGSGFYKTDSRNEKKGAPAAAPSASSSDSATPAAKSDSAPSTPALAAAPSTPTKTSSTPAGKSA
ncbi:MAG: Zinc ribbon domain protein [Frankiales bacterium]|nr:Zinc ribbon domain protein [Frankiales bacterium]